MLLSDIFDYLVHGELAQLAIAEEQSISLTDYPKLITNINFAMIELYKRFPIRVRELNIDLRNDITLYNLHSDYAQSNTASTQPIKYIADATVLEPFKDDILLITNIYNELGTELPLNDLDAQDSVFTPSPVTLQVPEAYDDSSLSIIYRANPTKINYNIISDPEIIDVEIYPQFLEALTAYVAWRIFSPINIGKNGEANSYYQKFEAACALINQLGIMNIDNTQNLRFGENGWL